ncbi:MAG: kinase, partial [Caulobacteraceae bacterium]
MADAALDAFMAEHGLDEGFRRTAEMVCEPLAARAHRRRIDRKRPAVIGLCGAQGSGKSTIAAWTKH